MGARAFECSVTGPRGKRKRSALASKAPGASGRGDPLKRRLIQHRIEACAARRLCGARPHHPRCRFRCSLVRRRERQIGGRHRGHVELNIDPIEQRSGETRLVSIAQRGPRRHAPTPTPPPPHRHGFIAPASRMRAG